ncbi:MAG: acetyl-CoA carboxylase biotin carboxyl carrier protein [Polyangiaceae bacterium]|nr:acetyl-CoA carboxylase biotin carboxyl carrier protein [Polyangiaceae bacterium]
MNLDFEELGRLLRLLERRHVHEFEYEDEARRVRIVRGAAGRLVAAPDALYSPPPAAAPSVAPPSPSAAPPKDDGNALYVTSPFVGTFYRSPSPDAPPFVDVGSTVRLGQTLCIVEAMKLMNEIEADCAGVIEEVLTDNGKSVEFGQKLFKIRKA